ncbi:hypothetical protein PBCV1_a119L [Paramecium bursaria Chlorella virus 1]|uniref:Uncharacterized protein n=1 Tax=Paramecium bursaria Chlorella virus 1 TaxID=10506 RepID=Q84440_PBCV1|nr:hypothetical protein PBCV1_a119L [Paramecium bursaria Chlorella virus 1]AAC96487.1 hypothetical protein [Paramecium bursaria Chlorella virus 1]
MMVLTKVTILTRNLGCISLIWSSLLLTYVSYHIFSSVLYHGESCSLHTLWRRNELSSIFSHPYYKISPEISSVPTSSLSESQASYITLNYLFPNVSEITIIFTSSFKVVLGSQPNTLLAFVASPTRRSTSAGR